MRKGFSVTVHCTFTQEVNVYILRIRYSRAMSTLSASVAVEAKQHRQVVMACVHLNKFTSYPNIVATQRPFITSRHFLA